MELQGEESTSSSRNDRIRRLLPFLGGAVILGGLALWMTWPSSDDIMEEVVEELDEIPAATAPPIVPADSEPAIDVPETADSSLPTDPALASSSFISPAVEETSSSPVDMPEVELLSSSPASNDARRSRLRDALNASIRVEVKAIVDTDNEQLSEDSRLSSMIDDDDSAAHHVLVPGTIIPAVLLQGINTELPGIAVAHVGRDVHDSRTATTLLIPRGSRIFGTYGTDTVESNERVLVSWDRIDLPNGNVIELGEVVGADQSGYAGLKDQVNRRTGRALTVTGLTSLITAGLTHAANASDPAVLRETATGEFVEEPSLSRDATREIARNYGNLASQIAQQHLSRGPTLTIRPGYIFVIQIAEEISLSAYVP